MREYSDLIGAESRLAEYRAKLMAGAASFNDLEVMEVFEHWRLLINNGYINQNCNDIDYTDATKMIYEGEAAMTLNGTWITGDFENIYHWKGGEDFDIFAFPSINSNVPDVVVGVIDLILQAKTENHTGT